MTRTPVDAVEPLDDEWLVIIDPQMVFADPVSSPWGSPMWAEVVPRIVRLAAAYAGRVVITRFVADPGLGGTWSDYYDDWPFALVPDEDPLYAVVPKLAPLADHVVTEGTFGKWGAQRVGRGRPAPASPSRVSPPTAASSPPPSRRATPARRCESWPLPAPAPGSPRTTRR